MHPNTAGEEVRRRRIWCKEWWDVFNACGFDESSRLPLEMTLRLDDLLRRQSPRAALEVAQIAWGTALTFTVWQAGALDVAMLKQRPGLPTEPTGWHREWDAAWWAVYDACVRPSDPDLPDELFDDAMALIERANIDEAMLLGNFARHQAYGMAVGQLLPRTLPHTSPLRGAVSICITDSGTAMELTATCLRN